MNLPSGKCHNFNLSQLFTCTFDTFVLSRCIFGALYCIDYFKAASGARPLRNRRSGNASIFVIYLGCREPGHVTVRGSHVIAQRFHSAIFSENSGADKHSSPLS